MKCKKEEEEEEKRNSPLCGNNFPTFQKSEIQVYTFSNSKGKL
jgi:hypothetical protein